MDKETENQNLVTKVTLSLSAAFDRVNELMKMENLSEEEAVNRVVQEIDNEEIDTWRSGIKYDMLRH